MTVNEKKRLTKNQKRRLKKKEHKNDKSVLSKEVIQKEVEKLEQKEQTQEIEEDNTEIVYDSEFERVKEQYKELEEVFKKFAVKEASQSEGFIVSQAAAAGAEDGKVTEKQEETGESLMNTDEKDGVKKMSKKARKLASRLTVAELKQLVRRPDVVEVEDCTAADPRLLVYLKSYRNTVPVPKHWSSKRHYLQGRRGIEKPQFKLPEYIANTGISDIRASIAEEEREKSLQTQARERMHPKLHQMDISYDVLEDAFFKHMVKPKMTGFGETYYEGKEYEVRLTEKRPGKLSQRLRDALGMSPLAPPPWLWMQQRYGPPPSYPNLRIPGLNSPIPPGCQYGNHAEGWGRPPVDEQGRPIYGDVFGVYVEEKALQKVNPEEVPLWGELPAQTFNEESSEEEAEEEIRRDVVQPVEEEETEEEMTVIPGSNIPAAVPLRKDMGDSMSNEPKSLYTRLEEVEVSGGEGFLPPTKRYVMPNQE